MTPQAAAKERPLSGSGVIAPVVLALFLGVFLVLGTGLANSEAIHAAAHDSRHAFAFPCH